MKSTEEKGTGVGVEAHRTRDVAGSVGLCGAARKLDALAHQLGVRGGVVAHAKSTHEEKKAHTQNSPFCDDEEE